MGDNLISMWMPFRRLLFLPSLFIGDLDGAERLLVFFGDAGFLFRVYFLFGFFLEMAGFLFFLWDVS
jgi:hypothetical protein